MVLTIPLVNLLAERMAILGAVPLLAQCPAKVAAASLEPADAAAGARATVVVAAVIPVAGAGAVAATLAEAAEEAEAAAVVGVEAMWAAVTANAENRSMFGLKIAGH